MTKPRIVVAGLGDSGLLTAINLARDVDVVGISTKPGMVSSQELGMRLARPDEWQRQYRFPFDSFCKLDPARIIHGTVTDLDLDDRTVTVKDADGETQVEPYDVLVIATGVTNGFWRRPEVQTSADVDETLRTAHQTLGDAGSIAIIGGGAAAVSSAANLSLA